MSQGGAEAGTLCAGDEQRFDQEALSGRTGDGDEVRGRAAVPQYRDIGAVARHLIAKALATGGFRTLVTSESGRGIAAETAGALARAIAAAGGQVVLVDWDVAGSVPASLPSRPPAPGLTEILLGEALFEDVIRREPASPVHVMGPGRPFPGGARKVDPYHLNLVLDALDEAYGHILVVGGHPTSRILFEAIEGRFDAGVVVADGESGARAETLSTGMLLGFGVVDIEVVHYTAPGAPGLLRRLVRRL